MPSQRNFSLRLVCLVGCLSTAVLSPGCAPAARPGATEEAAASNAPEAEDWYVVSLQGVKVGTIQVIRKPKQESGQSVIETELIQRLKAVRFGQQNEQEMRLVSWETPDGKLLRFRSEMQLGLAPTVMTGQVAGGKLRMTIRGGDKSVESVVPWSDEILGFFAEEQTLRRKPLEKGERRSFQSLVPLLNVVAQTTLVAGDYETVRLSPEREAKLLKVESQTRLPDGGELVAWHWVDDQGRILRSRVDAMQQEIVRATRAAALAEGTAAPLDLGRDLTIPLARPLPNPTTTRRARYRVDMKGGDPTRLFSSGPLQQVRSVGPEAIEITVTSLRPLDAPGEATSEPDPGEPDPGEEERLPNQFIQSDDPLVVKMAAEAGEQDPARLAVALESYVHRAVTKKDFSLAMASAAEVAQTRTGDCTEHAVLLAALARARGIPSRVAMGLVYVPSAGGFQFHMWTEAYVGGRWLPLDGTQGEGGVGADRLKLIHSSLAGSSAYSGFLTVAQAIGRLKIDLLAVE